MNFTNRNHFYRSPDPDGSGGGAANVSAPAGNEAASTAPVFDASAYVPREQFEQLQGQLGQYETKFRDIEGRLPKPEVKADAEPSMDDFLENGEMTKAAWSKYQAAVNNYHFKRNVSEYERERGEQQQQEYTKTEERKIVASHQKRLSEYKSANPDFNPTQTRFDRDVALAIAESDFSPQILHYLQKNPDKMAALREMEENNVRGAVRFIGRLESQFENKAASAPLPAGKPTRNAFGGGAAKPAQRDPLEIAKEWRN